LIFNELEYAETMLTKGFIQNKYLTELRVLAKYYNKIDELKTDKVKVKLKEFCKKYMPEYNEVIHLDLINKATNYGVQKKNTITVIPPIYITKNQLHKIGELNDIRLEKLAFTALVLSNMNKYKPKNKYNKGDTYTIYNFKELFKYAKVKCNQEQKDELINQLVKSGLFNYTIYGGLKINFFDDIGEIGDIGEPVITLSNFDNFVLEYEKYIGGNVINCEKCGVLFYPTNNKNKYCSEECAKEIKLEQNKLWKREYDKSRKIENC